MSTEWKYKKIAEKEYNIDSETADFLMRTFSQANDGWVKFDIENNEKNANILNGAIDMACFVKKNLLAENLHKFFLNLKTNNGITMFRK